MSFWGEIVGQAAAVNTLKHALHEDAKNFKNPQTGQAMPHAWLITGPPGSGRYNLALRFATAIIAGAGDPDNPLDNSAATPEQTEATKNKENINNLYEQIKNGSHPDVLLVRTQTTQIEVAKMRQAITTAYYAPRTAHKRIIIIEDADRLNMESANAALKALEEPPETTVWVLCAPSPADMLPTILSRTRMLRLGTPDPENIAKLLAERDHIDPQLAAEAAYLAQGHIGMAKKLVTDPKAMARRQQTIDEVLAIQTLASTMQAAKNLYALAQKDAEDMVTETITNERTEMMRELGLKTTDTVPKEYAKQLAAIDTKEVRKKLTRRAETDGLDRILVDLLTLTRDLMLTKLGTAHTIINKKQATQITQIAANMPLERMNIFAAALEEARDRLHRNITPALVLEAALVTLLINDNSVKT